MTRYSIFSMNSRNLFYALLIVLISFIFNPNCNQFVNSFVVNSRLFTNNRRKSTFQTPFSDLLNYLNTPSLETRRSAIENDVFFDTGSAWTTSVETFDGSLVDPVVVSGVFWSSLKAKFLSLIIGQLLASLIFSALITFVGSTVFSAVGSMASSIFKETMNATTSTIAASSNQSKYSSSVDIDIGKLFVCLIIDTIGTSSEFVPLLGEVTDLAWAPVAAIILRSMFGSNVVLLLEFAEEILPFTDFLPLATICWFIETFAANGDIAKGLQIGIYGKDSVVGVLDVEASNVTSDLKRINSSKD